MLTSGGIIYLSSWIITASVASAFASMSFGEPNPWRIGPFFANVMFQLPFWCMLCFPAMLLNAIIAKTLIYRSIKASLKIAAFVSIGMFTGLLGALVATMSIGSDEIRMNTFTGFGIPVFAAFLVASCSVGLLCVSQLGATFNKWESFNG